MTAYKAGVGRRRNWTKLVLFFGLAGLLIAVAGIFGIKSLYENNLKPVDSSSQEDIIYTLESGSTTPQIAESLHDKDIIRSARAFQQYVRSEGVGQDFIAGTYRLRRSYDVPTIVGIMTEGKIAMDLFTILPGKQLEQIKQAFINEGFSEAEVDSALNPEQYADHPALVDKPAGASLEGYLYPDSYQKIAETKPETIIRQSLDEMAEALTPEVRAGIAAQGLSVYDGIILASIVEREVGDRDAEGHPTDYRPKAAQVFLKRLRIGMKLQSNATDNFPETHDTYTIDGLPPTPISNVTKSSLQAVTNPAATDHLYFVSGKDCITRFSNTVEEHDALKSQHGVAQPEDNCRG